MNVKVVRKVVKNSVQKKLYNYCGDVFMINDEPHILCQVEYDIVCLVNMIEGNRWDDPVQADVTDMIYPSEICEYLRDKVDFDEDDKLEYLGNCEVTVTQL